MAFSPAQFFPYPLREAQGQITFGYDAATDADFVHILNVRGRGVADGPNRDGYISLQGVVGPLGPEYPDPQVVLRVKADSVYSEPVLIRPCPPKCRSR